MSATFLEYLQFITAKLQPLWPFPLTSQHAEVGTAREKCVLYHTPSSYYSMIARLSLLENGIDVTLNKVDIHRKQSNFTVEYCKLNPHMTVPTLVLPHLENPLIDSRDILKYAFSQTAPPTVALAEEIETWIERLYAFPVEDLTVCWLLSWNPILRARLETVMRQDIARLETTGAAHSSEPALLQAYQAKVEVMRKRIAKFGATRRDQLLSERTAQAIVLLDSLNAALADGRTYLVGDCYTAADVCAAVFLARIRFVNQSAAIEARAPLLAYETLLFARPATAAADLWTFLNPLKFFAQIFF